MAQQREGKILQLGIVAREALLDVGQLVVRISVAINDLEQRLTISQHCGGIDKSAQAFPVLSHMGRMEKLGRNVGGVDDVARQAAGATAGNLVVLDKGAFG